MSYQPVPSNQNHICLFDGVVPQPVCRKTIELFERDPNVKPGLVYDDSGNLIESGDKKSLELVIDLQRGSWGQIHESLQQAVVESVLVYIKDRPG
ncbi:MAG: hypothetical protein KDD43_16245, partial [Bdellovibrionales bacterium]|nr:hypothetical protein [Bdellovibrionales bacterium]